MGMVGSLFLVSHDVARIMHTHTHRRRDSWPSLQSNVRYNLIFFYPLLEKTDEVNKTTFSEWKKPSIDSTSFSREISARVEIGNSGCSLPRSCLPCLTRFSKIAKVHRQDIWLGGGLLYTRIGNLGSRRDNQFCNSYSFGLQERVCDTLTRQGRLSYHSASNGNH